MTMANVKLVTETFIKPKYDVKESKQAYNLAPMDLAMLSLQYIQEGLMFVKPFNDQHFSTQILLDTLKDSLSLTLVHFYPLAGRLVTRIDQTRNESLVFVDCTKGPGAKFIHATLDMTISDILSPNDDIPSVVHSFFDHNMSVNHDGHDQPLLSVQVTELFDGVFIGCSINHCVLDGTSYWHFWNLWSKIHTLKSSDLTLSNLNLPVHNRWFPDGYGPTVTLPYTNPNEFITRYEETYNREKMFHFSSESLAKLKAQAQKDSRSNTKISSSQALTALVWRSIVQAKYPSSYDDEQVFNCILVANDCHRLNPELPKHYFGNCINFIYNKMTPKELLEQNLGWAASLLNQSVVNHDDAYIRGCIIEWLKSRAVYQSANLFNSNSLMITHSPRFDMYGNEFGLRKAIAVRSGYGFKFGGVVAAYPGCEGNGSIDLEICLPPHTMSALESNQEFMGFVSVQPAWNLTENEIALPSIKYN